MAEGLFYVKINRRTMLLDIINTHLIDFVYVIPEICLLFATLHCLLFLSKSKRSFSKARNHLVYEKSTATSLIIFRTTSLYLHIALLILSGFLVNISLDS